MRTEDDLRSAMQLAATDAATAEQLSAGLRARTSAAHRRFLPVSAALVVALVVATIAVALGLRGANRSPDAPSGSQVPAPLIDTDWILVRFAFHGQQVDTSQGTGIVFRSDGRFRTELDGCTYWLGTVSFTSDTATFDATPESHTCPGKPAPADPNFRLQTAAKKSILSGTARWSRSGNRLTVTHPGRGSLTYTRGPSDPPSPPIGTRSPRPTNQRTDPLADKTVNGYLAAAATNGRTGWVNSQDLAGPSPANPQQAGEWQTDRGHPSALYYPVYASVPTSARHPRVVGVFRVGDSATVPFTCASQDGVAFVVTPPVTVRGAGSPLAAARTVYARYGIAHFDAPATSWRAHPLRPSTVTVTSGRLSLVATQLRDKSWVITSGQSCFR